MKKIFIFSFLILVIIIIFVVSNNRYSDVMELSIDQEEAFIAISSNDPNGYNRWIPFYFSLQTKSEYSINELENKLNKTISGITLYSEERDVLFTTDKLVWSAFQIDNNLYNLSLVIIPDLEELVLSDRTTINKIMLTIGGENIEYDLTDYIIETKETIPEETCYVSQSTMETSIGKGLLSEIHYHIMSLDDNKLTDFALNYPSGLSKIKNYEVVENNQKDNENIL